MSSLFPPDNHDHSHCIKTVMSHAEALCREKGLRLTNLRADILREVASSHKAIGAYQILDNLAKVGKRLAPISVYRSLDFLLEAGLIHRLESVNAYFACQDKLSSDQSCCSAQSLVFLVCDDCGTIGEADGRALKPLIDSYVADSGFERSKGQLEIKGLCPSCQGTSTPSEAFKKV